MGWVMMSERELNRIEVLSQVVQGRMSAVTAADVLALSRGTQSGACAKLAPGNRAKGIRRAKASGPIMTPDPASYAGHVRQAGVISQMV